MLTGRTAGADQIVLRRGRVLIMNRMPISLREHEVGSVVTLRDRTEIVTLRHELDSTRGTTDALRAQAHEFTNRLHTIAGLIELGEYDEVRRYVDRVSHTREAWQTEVGERIATPPSPRCWSRRRAWRPSAAWACASRRRPGWPL